MQNIQNLVFIEKLSLNEFVQRCSQMKKVSPRKRQWLSLIKANKLTCPVTGYVTDHVKLEKNQHKRGTYSLHYNFYSKEGHYMTVDHIIPKSKGGSHFNIENLQPMYSKENSKKSDNILPKNTSGRKSFQKS